MENAENRLQRIRMVETQIEARGIRDARVLEAMRSIPRDLFVPSESAFGAFEDRALPIGMGQTISQPYIVALMTQLLAVEPQHRVLEIGTGSGYQTAILAMLARHVFSIGWSPCHRRPASNSTASASQTLRCSWPTVRSAGLLNRRSTASS